MPMPEGTISSSKTLAPYVLPFSAFIIGLALVPVFTRENSSSLLLTNPKFWIYPLQTLICGVLLVVFWKHYDFGAPRGWRLALGTGFIVLGIWLAPQLIFGAPARTNGFDPTALKDQTALYTLTIFSRFARLVIIAPVVEEIFWRGFLMRYLIREDFMSVRFGTFQWRAFLLVALSFMLVHHMADWPAAFLCGLAYNFIAVRTGSLGACILAHSLTNLGLGIYIMATSQWGFW